MKKHTFYSLVMGANRQPMAQKWDGYTDNIFNYYKDNFNRWYAIEPSTGLSVTSANTRKATQEQATTPAMFKKINDKITQDMIHRFKSLVLEAQCL